MSELVDVTGVDFASELMLNKMMNGQVASSNGNTITAGLRSQASALYRDSIEPSIASANVSAAIPDVTETQSAITEAKVYIENLYDNIITGDYSTVASTISEGVAWLGNFLDTYSKEEDADSATTGATTTVDIGLGSTYDVGGINLSSIAALYSQLSTINDEYDAENLSDGYNALEEFRALEKGLTSYTAYDGTDTSISDATATSYFNNAIDEAIDGMTVTSMQIQTLQNRSLMLEEVASTYSTAGDSQILTGAGSTSGLLSSIIS